MQPIAFFYPQGHEAHARPGHEEQPERVESIRTALQQAGYWENGLRVYTEALPVAVLQAVHREQMLETVRRACEMEANLDADTYTNKASWQLALNAAGGAAALARAVWRREADTGFALTRPPGHHATPTQAMGFCLLNNAALAAESLIQQENAKHIAIIDMDVHHGNGTQDIFYARGDVMYISTHQSPFYPGTGMLDERGRGAGEGTTANMPLPAYSGDGAFGQAYGEIVPSLLDRFGPEMILVSLGFDSHWKDPLASLLVSARGYGEAIGALRAWAQKNCDGRISLLLEGGYDLEAIAACGVAATQALLGEEIIDTLGPVPQGESKDWVPVLNQVKEIWDL
ncbi:MAG: histone deacetylase [Anaerolineales bacterium]